MIIKVPAPTPGRVVYTMVNGEIFSGFVLGVLPDPKRVDLVVFDSVAEESIYYLKVPYGEGKNDHWWWPPRSTEMMEIEATP